MLASTGGQFWIREIPTPQGGSTRYRLHIYAWGLHCGGAEEIDAQAHQEAGWGEGTTVDVDVSPDSVTELEVRVGRCEGATLQGRITLRPEHPWGLPLETTVSGRTGGGWVNFYRSMGPDGGFLIEHVPPGSYWVEIKHSFELPASQSPGYVVFVCEEIQIGEPETVRQWEVEVGSLELVGDPALERSYGYSLFIESIPPLFEIGSGCFNAWTFLEGAPDFVFPWFPAGHYRIEGQAAMDEEPGVAEGYLEIDGRALEFDVEPGRRTTVVIRPAPR